MKRLWATLLATGLLATHTVAATAAAWDFPNASTVPNGTTLVAVNEPNVFDGWSQWSSYLGDRDSHTSRLCPNGVDQENCNPNVVGVNAVSVVSACKDTVEAVCVESIRAKQGSGEWIAASFSRGVIGQTYSASAQSAIPAGRIGLWNLALDSGQTLRLASVVKVKQFFDRSKGRFIATGLSANVTPFSERAGGSIPQHFEGDYNGNIRVFTRHDPSCIWEEQGACGLPEEYPNDLELELVIHVPSELKGWFRGRLEGPSIRIESKTSSISTITVQAKPVTVPRISVLARPEQTPESLRLILEKTGGKNPTAPLFTGNSIKDFFANEGERLFEVINGLRASAGDTAQGLSTLWNFTTIEFPSKESCFALANEVLGVVTTNATGYVGDPPEFRDGTLEYRVAGFHYSPDGQTLNLGTYDLVMSSKVARCLYGFSSAPISAKIQVVSENGESVVASTVVREKDGWLNLSAYGFTFSEKNIRVQLTQAKPPVLKTSVAGFSSKATSLSSRQKQQVSNLASKVDFHTAVICTATYRTTAEKVLAGKRAASTCRLLQTLKPELRTSTRVSKASSSKQSNLVLVSIN